MKQIKINGRIIGEGYPAYIIAEMSANHAGSLERAKEIIRVAKESGADCVKIQTYTADTITLDCNNQYFHINDGPWEGENLHSLYEKAYTPWEWQKELYEEAKRVGIDFFSTPFDKTAVDFLEEIGMTFYKIASFELVDLPLIKYTAQKGKPMILSTGMASLAEIEEAVATIRATGNEQFALLRCASAYPAISDQMNLLVMKDMGDRFDIPVGLSDHSMGGLAAAASVAMGGCIIEKHLCLSRDIENPDSSFSMEPAEFTAMVDAVRQVERAKGTVSYGTAKQESTNKIFRKSIFVAEDIKAGEVFTEKNIRVVRPGYGLHSREYEFALGRKCLTDVTKGTPLRADLIVDYLTFKKADEMDVDLLFTWANDEETRKQSFHSEKIPYEDHIKWFESSLARKDREIYICSHGAEKIGVLRLDYIQEDTWEISYSIAPSKRGKGYGKEMLRLCEDLCKGMLPGVKKLTARVKAENEGSVKIFTELQYTKRLQKDYMVFEKEIGLVKPI